MRIARRYFSGSRSASRLPSTTPGSDPASSHGRTPQSTVAKPVKKAPVTASRTAAWKRSMPTRRGGDVIGPHQKGQDQRAAADTGETYDGTDQGTPCRRSQVAAAHAPPRDGFAPVPAPAQGQRGGHRHQREADGFAQAAVGAGRQAVQRIH